MIEYALSSIEFRGLKPVFQTLLHSLLLPLFDGNNFLYLKVINITLILFVFTLLITFLKTELSIKFPTILMIMSFPPFFCDFLGYNTESFFMSFSLLLLSNKYSNLPKWVNTLSIVGYITTRPFNAIVQLPWYFFQQYSYLSKKIIPNIKVYSLKIIILSVVALVISYFELSALIFLSTLILLFLLFHYTDKKILQKDFTASLILLLIFFTFGNQLATLRNWLFAPILHIKSDLHSWTALFFDAVTEIISPYIYTYTTFTAYIFIFYVYVNHKNQTLVPSLKYLLLSSAMIFIIPLGSIFISRTNPDPRFVKSLFFIFLIDLLLRTTMQLPERSKIKYPFAFLALFICLGNMLAFNNANFFKDNALYTTYNKFFTIENHYASLNTSSWASTYISHRQHPSIILVEAIEEYLGGKIDTTVYVVNNFSCFRVYTCHSEIFSINLQYIAKYKTAPPFTMQLTEILDDSFWVLIGPAFVQYKYGSPTEESYLRKKDLIIEELLKKNSNFYSFKIFDEPTLQESTYVLIKIDKNNTDEIELIENLYF